MLYSSLSMKIGTAEAVFSYSPCYLMSKFQKDPSRNLTAVTA